VVNLVNGSTLFGAAVALAGGARLARVPGGLLVASGYRPAVPVAPAFTIGNVIIVNRRHPQPLPAAMLAHEARHSTQYAWCGGLLMLPLYFTALGISWALCGNIGSWNVFERQAGLADGGYAERPARPALRALAGGLTRWPRRSPGPTPPGSASGPAGPAGSTATSSR
jgi:hypothetical protein